MIHKRLNRWAALFHTLVLIGAVTWGEAQATTVIRGPYLQVGTPTSVELRWLTDVATDSAVRFGLELGALSNTVSDSAVTTEHSITITGLQPNTQYYYEFGASSAWFPGNPNDYFVTAPPPGGSVPTRIWAIGDSGTADNKARLVRDAYRSFGSGRHTDVWLMLGDNAYSDGAETEYQEAVFDMYPMLLQNTFLWSTRGNHEEDPGVYYGIFSMPANGEAGGLPPGSEAYYSFDFGNIHFICLDSFGSDRSAGGRWQPG